MNETPKLMNINIIKTCTYAYDVSLPQKFDFSQTSKMGKLCSVFMAANSFGIDIYLPFDLVVTWKGGNDFAVECKNKEVIEYIWTSEYEKLIGIRSNFWCSKIPGVFQLDPGLIYHTPQNTKLLLQGPMNVHDSSTWVHTGILDSDWFHVPSTINIQFSVVDTSVHVTKKKPIARLIPIGGYNELPEIYVNKSCIVDWPECISFWKQYIHEIWSSDSLLNRSKYGVYAELKERVENGTL